MSRHLIFSVIVLLSCNVTFANQKDTLKASFNSEGFTLKGKIIVPKEKTGKIPAIIFLVGSGGSSSPFDEFYSEFLNFFWKNLLKMSM